MEGWEEGPDEVFQQLRQATLDAEAFCEANTSEAKGLIPLLSESLGWGRSALDHEDREQSDKSRVRLEDLLEQVRARLSSQGSAGIDVDQRLRDRIAGWVSFIEAEALPRFWDLLTEEQRENAIAGLKGLRIMLQTGAPGSELSAQFEQFRGRLCDGDAGLLFEAWICAWTIGIPERTSDALDARIRQLERTLAAGDKARIAVEAKELREHMVDAWTAWRPFRETGSLIGARPDLVPKKPDTSRAN